MRQNKRMGSIPLLKHYFGNEKKIIMSEKKAVGKFVEQEDEKQKIKENVDGGNNGEKISYHTLEEMAEHAYRIHNICNKMLKKYYDKKKMKLPIDIEMVAKKMGIEIEYSNLNFGIEDGIDQNIAQLRYEEGEKGVIRKIFVDNSESRKRNLIIEPLSNLKKYAVAYELGKTIFNEDMVVTEKNLFQLNMKSKPYSLPRLSARLENFQYEMCAIFLLLPIELFLEEFCSYLEGEKQHPVLMGNWIKHLSEKTEIHDYQLINGYQYIKFSAYKYYKENLSREIKGKDYTKLYNY